MVKARYEVRKYEPISGVKTDFEKLLQKFTSTGTVRYENFAEIWREMKMSMLCSGRQEDREVREFMEECISIAKQFLLPPSNFQTRVGALYLLYGLYMMQPCLVKVKICVTSSEWIEILKFQSDASQQQHLDVDYIFHFLHFQKAFQFAATATEVYPLGRDTNEAKSSISENFKEDMNPLTNLFPSELHEQLAAINDQYYAMKVELAGPGSHQPDNSLNVIQPELVHNITRTLNNYQKMEYGTACKSDEETQGEGKSKLKQKAFSNVARALKSRRHRQVIEEFSSSPESSPKKKMKISPKKAKKIKDAKQEKKTVEISDTVSSSSFYSMPQLSTDVEDVSKKDTKSLKQSSSSSKNHSPDTKKKLSVPKGRASSSKQKPIDKKSDLGKWKENFKTKRETQLLKTKMTSELENNSEQEKEPVSKPATVSETAESPGTRHAVKKKVSLDKGKKIPKMRAELPEPRIKKKGRPKKRKFNLQAFD